MKKFLSLALVAMLAFSLTACSGNNANNGNNASTTTPSTSTTTPNTSNSENTQETEENQTTQTEENTTAEENTATEENNNANTVQLPERNLTDKKITFYSWNTGDSIFAQKFKDAYKEHYDGEIDWIFCDWDNYETTFTSSVLAGTAPDVFAFRGGDYPNMLYKGYFQNMNDKINFDSPLWEEMKEQNDSRIFNGEHQVAATSAGAARFIWYNKSMFLNEGLESPEQLALAGKWDWNKLVEYAKKFLKDTDNDGQNDVFGLGGGAHMIAYALMMSDKVDFVTKDASGKFVNNFDSPDLAKTMNFLYNMYVTEGIMAPDGSEQQAFAEGKLAMLYEGIWTADNDPLLQMHKDGIIGIAPIPRGNDQSEYSNYGEVTLYGISKNAKNPEGAAAMIDVIRFLALDEATRLEGEAEQRAKGFTDTELQFAAEANKKAVVMESGTIYNGWNLTYGILWGAEWTTMREEQKPVIQQAIDDINSLIQ